VFFLVFEESYLVSFLPFGYDYWKMKKGGSNCVEGNKKFGVLFLLFFPHFSHHKFLQIFFLGSKCNDLLYVAILFKYVNGL
jgi:hypothetical protein